MGGGGERRRGQPEPLVAGIVDLPELMADHELLHRGERDGVGDRLDVQPIALVGRHAARARVRVVEIAMGLELRHHVADRGWADPEAIAAHQGLAAHRQRGGDVFLDDGPQDRLGSGLQRTGSVLATRHGPLTPGHEPGRPGGWLRFG